MSIEKVKAYFKTYGMEDKILEFDVSSATVELAALALHCEPQRIAKTLSFLADGQTVLIVTAGDRKIDNKKYKAQFGTKAKMLSAQEAETLVGHAVGGICPFAVNEGVSVYLDQSLRRFETVFPACGSSNSAIELTIAQLEQYSGYAEWVDVCKEVVFKNSKERTETTGNVIFYCIFSNAGAAFNDWRRLFCHEKRDAGRAYEYADVGNDRSDI